MTGTLDAIAREMREAADAVQMYYVLQAKVIAFAARIEAITALSNQGEGECWDAIAIYEAIGRGELGYEDKFYTAQSSPAEADRRDAEQEWQPTPCPTCGGFCGDSGQTCAEDRSEAYDMLDRYLRNNMDDSDYAEYSAALEVVFAAPVSPSREELSAEYTRGRIDGWEACEAKVVSPSREVEALDVDDRVVWTSVHGAKFTGTITAVWTGETTYSIALDDGCQVTKAPARCIALVQEKAP